MMKRKQQSIQQGVDSRQIRGRNNKQPVLRAAVNDFITGITTMVYTREKIVFAATKSNLHQQLQMIGTVFRHPVFFNAFGPYANKTTKTIVLMSSMAHLSLIKILTLMLFQYLSR